MLCLTELKRALIQDRIKMASPTLPQPDTLAETLPSHYYTDESMLEIEQKRIFSKTWQYVGTTDALQQPGDYFTVDLAGVPVLITRGRDGVNAMVNVCRHRLHQVATGCGNARKFTCPYHAWTYGLDGSLVAAPRTKRIVDFDRNQHPLERLPVATWGPCVFVSLDPEITPFSEWIGPADEALKNAGVEIEKLVLRKQTSFEIAGNWKVVAENYLECYHCTTAHPSYSQTFDTASAGYQFEIDEHSFIATTKPTERFTDSSTAPYDATGPICVNQNNFLWPNFCLATWPGQNNLIVFGFRPLGVGRTAGTFDYLMNTDADPDAANDFISFVDEVGHEDVPLIEAVQRGLDSGRVERGRLVPDEAQLVHFQKLVLAAVSGAEAPEKSEATEQD